METLNLPKSVLLKKVIRYEEEIYVLEIVAEFSKSWETFKKTIFVRSDVNSLGEILRLERNNQTIDVEDILVDMLSHGEPPSIDLKELTGEYLELTNCELVIKMLDENTALEVIHGLPQIVDVFQKYTTENLSTYLNLEKEFSSEILQKTFYDFQKSFYLIERGFNPESAFAMTQTNNPISAMIYNKIRQQLETIEEEKENTVVLESNEDILEENYFIPDTQNAENFNLPF